MKWFHFLALCLIASTYFIFRLGWRDTIQFGYDQPRLASTVQDFINNGTFLTSQNYALESPWGNISWGPALVFVFAAILKISGNPLVASQIIAVVNVISIIAVMAIGWKFFSPRMGIVAGFLLSVQPWWIIFSRMVYQPSLVPTLISLSMLLTFLTIDKHKNYFISILIFSWAVLSQFYLVSLSFIVTSAAYLIFNLKKLSIRWAAAGILASFLLFVPSFYYYENHRTEFLSFFGAPGKFNTTVIDVVVNYFKTVSGGNFVWELGYGYQSFILQNKWVEPLVTVNLALITLIIFGSLVKSFSEKNSKYRLLLILWTIAPLWFLSFVKVEYTVPRYFLISLPPLSLLIALAVEDMYKKIGGFVYIIPIYICMSWAALTLGYFSFIENYNYPKGILSHFSDPPYLFLKQSFDTIVSDSKGKGYGAFTLSVDPSNPDVNVFDWSTNYVWSYVYKLGKKQTGSAAGHYLIYSKPGVKNFEKIGEYGPYLIYSIKN